MAGGVPAGRLSIEIVAEVARLQADMDKVKRAVKDASNQIAKDAKAANDNLAGLGSGISKAGNTSKLAGHHVQNLAFQFQDLGVQMAAAAGSKDPLKGVFTALIQQGSQIGGIMSQAKIGVGGLIAAVGGMVAPFTPVIAAVAALGAGIALITSDINENSKVHVTWMDTALGAYDAVASYVSGKLTQVFNYFGTTSGDVWKSVVEWVKWGVNKAIGITQVLPRAIYDTWGLIPAGVADIFFSAVNRAIDAINSLISKSVSGVNGLISTANSILSKANMALPTLTAPQIAKVANNYAGAGAKLGGALVKSIKTSLTKDYLGDAAAAISPFAQARARQRMAKDAEKAGKDAGSKAGKAAAKKASEDFLTEWQRNLAGDVAGLLAKNQAEDWKRFMAELDNVVADKFEQARLATEKARREADAYAESIGNVVSQLGNLGKAGNALGALLGVLTGNTGGIGGMIGTILNLGVMGKDENGERIASTIGDELSKVFKKDGVFSKTIAPLLQGAGIGMTASAALLGKQTKAQQAGSAIGGALGGSKLVTGALSKGLDALSKGLGQFAGPLGSIVGGLLGSALGGLFKKVKWGRVDLTSAGVSGTSGNSGKSEKAALAAGNSIMSSLKDLATQLGGTISDFGSIAVGVRDGKYRVNTSGTSLKVKKGAVDFGDDAEAAAAYAMKQAIERGALAGIRQSTNNLLKAGDDLQSQLQKALNFEGVFAELKSYTDPVGAALDDVNKQFDQLRVIFKEAGATAEEYAQLEQLLTIKRQEAMSKEQDALDDIRSRIAEAQGDEATVKQIARAKELKDALNDNVRAELKHLYAVEDAAEAQQKLTDAQSEAAAAAAQLRDAWASIGSDLLDEVNRIRGLGTSGGASGFMALQGQFNAAVAAARAGDQVAAGKLVDLSQSLLDAAADAATSRQELDRIRMETAANLEGVAQLTGVLPSLADGLPGAGDKSDPATAEMRDEIAQMRSDLTAVLSTIAGNTGRIDRKLDNVTSASGGDAISVTQAA